MKWSKGWFTLVALAGALGLALAVVVPNLVQREIDGQVSHRLAAAAAGADAEVQLHARRWIDAASHAALDEQLAEALDHASTASANIDLLHATAQERLRGFQKEWKAWQAIAVDAHGRVIARVGAQPGGPGSPDERWKDDLSSAQVVTEALKGFRLDDTWLEDGRLLKVVAAPVTARDRYAGAVLVALDLGAELAQPLAERVGAEVVFVGGGKSLGHSAKAPSVDAVITELAKRASGNDPLPLPVGGDGVARVVLARPIAGSAAPLAMVVVIGEQPRIASVAALQSRLLAAPAQLPWPLLLPIGVGLVAALLLGWFLMGREHVSPLDKLQRALQAVLRGEMPRVDESGLKGRYGAIARTVNGLLDRSRPARVPSLLEVPAVPRPGTTPPHTASLPLPLQPEIPPDPLGSFTPLPPPAPAAASGAPAVTSRPLSPSPAYGSAPAFSSSLVGASSSGQAGAAAHSAPQIGGPPLHGPSGFGGASYPPPPAFAPAPPARGAGYVPLDPPISPAGSGVLGSLDEFSGLHPLGELPGQPGTAAAPAPAAVGETPDAEFQSVFQDFIDTRQRCGESVEGITFERFAVKLRGNRDQLMSRFGCKGVKFQVYVKDGKAALKATPVS